MSSSTPRIPQIQALRALAAGLVLIYHAHLVPGGYIGVDIFYVISGFLITGLLLREVTESGGIRLLDFYARRFRRLLPSSFIVITVTGIVGWLLLPASTRQVFGKDLIAASTYISNFLFALWNNDYQNLNATPSPFIHFWSLAVEEQFYLFWPFIILGLYKIGKRRGVLIGMAIIAALSFIFSLYLTERSPIWSFYILPTRAWELALGGLLIFAPKIVRGRTQLALIAVIALAYGTLAFDDQTAFPGTAALIPVLATAVLIATTSHWPPFLQIISQWRFTQWVGAISYPLYLWHWPVLVLPVLYWGRELTLFERIALLVATLFIADATHRFVEEPIRYLKLSTQATFKVAGLVTFISVALGAAIYLSYSNSVTIGANGSYSLDEIRSKPKNNDDGCHIHVRETVSPLCEYGDTTSNRVIILYGDSHAAQWLPALDIVGKKRGFKVVSLTKSSCPSAEVVKELSSQYIVADCQEFRDKTVARIASTKPIAVIMTGMQPSKRPYSDEDALSWWLAGEAKALKRIQAFTQYPIYLTDTPLPHRDIPDCLVQNLGSACDGAKPVDSTVAPGLIAINPTPWLCSDICPAMIDGKVVYRDKSHLTVAMSEYLAPKLEGELARIGIFESR